MNAGHIDDRAARLHGQERLPREVHRSEQVDIEDLLPVLLGQLLEGLEGHQAGVVHHDVEATEAVHCRFHGGCDLCLRGHIARHPERIRSAGLAHLTGTSFGRIALQVGDDDARAL